MVEGIWHVSFTVSDLEAAVAFYVDLLGGVCVRKQEQDNAYTRRLVGYPSAVLRIAQIRFGTQAGVSGHHVELVQYLSPLAPAVRAEVARPGCPHLALYVRDLAAEYERLLNCGVEFFSTPNMITEGINAGGSAIYFYGPDHIVHELVQPPSGLG